MPKVAVFRARPTEPEGLVWIARRTFSRLAGALGAVIFLTQAAFADDSAARLALGSWPEATALAEIRGRPFSFPSANPFTLADVGKQSERLGVRSAQAAHNPAQTAVTEPHSAHGDLFLPAGASAERPVPAVVLLHGARGVSRAREITYARQFAAMGLAALVVDVFASRRDRASSFTERLIEITESMALADAYGALRALAEMPEVDGGRVALVGFSYGGMTSIYAAHRQVAELYDELLELDGKRFAAHVAFYAPCIVRFENPEATGAPLLMMWGDKDELIDRARCEAAAADLRGGGAEVEIKVFPGAYHQWDGNLATPWRARRGLRNCDFLVTKENRTRGQVLGSLFSLPMTDSLSRKILLGMCSDSDGYLIGRDAAVREQSNAELGRFLGKALR